MSNSVENIYFCTNSFRSVEILGDHLSFDHNVFLPQRLLLLLIQIHIQLQRQEEDRNKWNGCLRRNECTHISCMYYRITEFRKWTHNALMMPNPFTVSFTMLCVLMTQVDEWSVHQCRSVVNRFIRWRKKKKKAKLCSPASFQRVPVCIHRSDPVACHSENSSHSWKLRCVADLIFGPFSPFSSSCWWNAPAGFENNNTELKGQKVIQS